MDGSTEDTDIIAIGPTPNTDANAPTANHDDDTSNLSVDTHTSIPDGDLNRSLSTVECAICLENCQFPTELPCKHIFCFLCIKGISSQSLQCALCRGFFPHTLLQNPKLLKPAEIANADNNYQWFYAGKSGWWQYDKRASTEIESAFQNKNPTCELLLAGHVYIIDFNLMTQYRKNDFGGAVAVASGRQRRIKRDRAIPNKLGVAGLRMSLASGSHQPTVQTPLLPGPGPSVAIPAIATPNRRTRRRQAQAAAQTPTITAAANRRRRRRNQRRNTTP